MQNGAGRAKPRHPSLKEVAKATVGQVRVIKIDIDKNPSIAKRFQVKGVPTLALFKNGKLIWKQSGVQTKHQIQSVLSQNI